MIDLLLWINVSGRGGKGGYNVSMAQPCTADCAVAYKRGLYGNFGGGSGAVDLDVFAEDAVVLLADHVVTFASGFEQPFTVE